MKETTALAHPPLHLALLQACPACLSLPGLLAAGLPCLEDCQQNHVPVPGPPSLGGADGPFFSSRRGEGWRGAPSSRHQPVCVEPCVGGALLTLQSPLFPPLQSLGDLTGHPWLLPKWPTEASTPQDTLPAVETARQNPQPDRAPRVHPFSLPRVSKSLREEGWHSTSERW